jgi:hypothetical protein
MQIINKDKRIVLKDGQAVLLPPKIVHQKAEKPVRHYGIRDIVKITKETGVYVHLCDITNNQ